jgi:hypothetical protein
VSAGTIATSTDYEYGPYLSVLPDGRAKLAWCDPANAKIYVRHLAADLSTSERADTVLNGYRLYGLATHSDGRSAVLTVTQAAAACTPCTTSTSCVACDQLHLVQLADNGTTLQQAVIDDRIFWTGAFGGGGIAVGTYAGAEHYAVSRTVRGSGQIAGSSTICPSVGSNTGHQWEETWLYKTSDLSVAASGCNIFPCGHSLNKRSVAHHANLAGFGTACVSDYNGTRTGFNYAQNNGWNNRIYNVWQDWPGFVNGGTPSELVFDTTTTFLTAFSAPRSCATDCAADAHDIALFQISTSTKLPTGPAMWMSSAAGWEKFPHLARYGSTYLLGYTTGTNTSDFTAPAHWWLQEVNAAGQSLAGPLEIPSTASFGYANNWATCPDGDVAWARRASSTTIDIVRVNR